VLRNLARGSNKGGDAKQDVALNQPKALPLIKNPAGDLGGYLYIPNVSGNYATGPSVTIGSNETWEGELDMVVTQWGNWVLPMGGGDWDTGFGLIFYSDKRVRTFSKGSVLPNISASGVTLGTPFNAKFGFDGTNLYVDIDDSRVYELVAPDQSGSITHPLELNQQAALTNVGNYAIQKAKLTVNNAVVFDCDFNGSTSIRHGDTKFKCATGQVVTINKSGNDPATVIKKPVLRFSDAASTSLGGVLASNLTEGYYFAALSFLGSVGSSGNPRLFSVYNSGDTLNDAIIFGLRTGTSVTTGDLSSYKGGTGGGYLTTHTNMGARDRGDVLHEVRYLTDGSAASSVNNSLDLTASGNDELNANKFILGRNPNGAEAASFDLEYLALFPATLTDAQADAVRNYINNRNTVFDLKDGFGYYFFDPQSLADGAVTSWNGRIVGSDNGDTDKLATQATAADQPTSDGYVVTFADNTDHLDIPSTTQAGWQVVGTSLGTFAYRVNNYAVTELNLLGNLGSTSFRQAGDLYGVILLPESATGKDIEDARKLLIDRGAADGTTASTVNVYFYGRGDIVEFKPISFSSATSLRYTWHQMSSLTSFPSLDLTNAVDVNNAWSSCGSLSSFGTTEIPNCSNFISAWQNCSSLTQFPSGAKLGTSAQSVDFTSAWQDSGLTSFPALDLSSGSTFFNAFRSTQITTIESGVLLGTASASANVNFQNAFRDTPLTSLPEDFNLSKGKYFTSAWQGCTALTSFPSDALLGTEAENVNFTSAWQQSGLNSFSTPLPTATNVNYAWLNCSSLESFSSELPSVTNALSAWSGCNSLTSFSSDLPSVSNAYAAWFNCTSLTSFSSDLSSVTNAAFAWHGCSSLTSFSAELPSVSEAALAWKNCSSLTDFSADVFANWNPSSIASGVFYNTWEGCTSLTAQSVENILVSIDASGHYATTNKLQGGTALGDAGIDIDYNVATGSLSAATTAAITSLKSKGWSIFINSVEQ
jgi:hypothetical protein